MFAFNKYFTSARLQDSLQLRNDHQKRAATTIPMCITYYSFFLGYSHKWIDPDMPPDICYARLYMRHTECPTAEIDRSIRYTAYVLTVVMRRSNGKCRQRGRRDALDNTNRRGRKAQGEARDSLEGDSTHGSHFHLSPAFSMPSQADNKCGADTKTIHAARNDANTTLRQERLHDQPKIEARIPVLLQWKDREMADGMSKMDMAGGTTSKKAGTVGGDVEMVDH
ncbi:hypothetical protein EK21DRAFT_83755 [Setomelanomma holmii]|uniref:Uncharacterized protein n=1 Tax=Setomelanomma holmii TaxID=210430 RepID=A0A9P4LUS0_9PLEO|nr:hypothetical protein EK21DRAFT_83755 [Setomelanomma holmii]